MAFKKKERRIGRRNGVSGRKRGSINKATREKRLIEARDRAKVELVDRINAGDMDGAVAQVAKVNRKLGKEMLSEAAHALFSLAAYYQPNPMSPRPTENEGKFLQYIVMAIDAASKVAPYESPRLTAVMVGQANTTAIRIIGGLPEPNALKAIEHDDDDIDAAVGEIIIDGIRQRDRDDQGADVSSGADSPGPDDGQADHGPVRKAVG